MTRWERRRPTLDELKPIEGQLTLDDLKTSNGRQEESHLADPTSEQSTHSKSEEKTALDGLTEVISHQK
ncbi:MAG TPA: hypothetical protein VIK37_00145 [Candidatus Saccharimonadales bacterium]